MNKIADLRRAIADEMSRLQPPPGLENRVLTRAFSRTRPIKTGPRSVALGSSAQALKLVGGLLVVVVLISGVIVGRLLREGNTPGHVYTLTSAEKAQLAELEARPLRFPAIAADGGCPVGPRSNITPYLGNVVMPAYESGPVYLTGGPRTHTAQANYFDVTYFTDPTVAGPVLIRGGQLDGRLQVVFVGPYAAGPVVGTDVINGKRVELRGEAVLPGGHPPRDPLAASGWGIWKVRQGIGVAWNGCAVIQIDSLAASEVAVVV